MFSLADNLRRDRLHQSRRNHGGRRVWRLVILHQQSGSSECCCSPPFSCLFSPGLQPMERAPTVKVNRKTIGPALIQSRTPSQTWPRVYVPDGFRACLFGSHGDNKQESKIQLNSNFYHQDLLNSNTHHSDAPQVLRWSSARITLLYRALEYQNTET